ncbi:MAG TPA: heavy metal translocating P-type ATPase metal-binding domain-containing protein [Puia sp.]|nr:heavy metal translocating P-type ATPase metal-binding domain-containing protein [Puia sp.]
MEKTNTALLCSHCGEPCPNDKITLGESRFCCEGCRLVYQLLNHNGLCTYYELNAHPGVSRRVPVRKDKFAFLDQAEMADALVSFRGPDQTHATFYLPAIHCSSCLYLLENLHRLHPGVLSSRIDFAAKTVFLAYDQHRISLREAAELLTEIGYEPYISLRDLDRARPEPNRRLIYRLGVAGFCFGNIMLLSFPEYLGIDSSESTLRLAFRYLSLLLALPVLFYSTQPFFVSAWNGLRSKFLHIDAPIALAVLVTFLRSTWEIGTGAGAGYFDSMSGIVFFMLAGRVLQDRTYGALSFDRDYTAYFPMAVTVLEYPAAGDPAASATPVSPAPLEVSRALPDVRCGDTLLIHNGELIPADGILTRGDALIDYSFVTGESLPVRREMGEIVYAGGRQTGAAIELLVIKEVAQSYLTQLWNRRPGKTQRAAMGGLTAKPASSDEMPGRSSFIHTLSRYFTIIVFTVAVSAAIYWQLVDPPRTWNAVTAVLIVACPCALLLSGTFTNGNLLRIMAKNHFYLRNAETIEHISGTTHIVFDKTGTLTDTSAPEIRWRGESLSTDQHRAIATLAAQSTHPLSRALAAYLGPVTGRLYISNFIERPGEGLDALIDGRRWTFGSPAFVQPQSITRETEEPGRASALHREDQPPGAAIYIACDGHLLGAYHFAGRFRTGLGNLIRGLAPRQQLTVLSGDNPQEYRRLQTLLGDGVKLLFDRSPQEKTQYIRHLQRQGEKVMMIGDGLNDAGALGQSDVGIAIAADCGNFTPSSDAILRADQLTRLPAFIRFCRSGRRIILASFVLSILYNIIGLWFAVHGALSPMVAAILMPASSLSILLVTYGSSNVLARVLLAAGRGPGDGTDKRNDQDQPGQ